jgi:hypothetical protein
MTKLVLRGGSWDFSGGDCRSAARGSRSPGNRYDDYGFRLKIILNQPRKEKPTLEYYDVGGIITIQVIQAKLTSEQFKGFLLGNVIKYALRCNHKGEITKDVRKLNDYANRLLKQIEEERRKK